MNFRITDDGSEKDIAEIFALLKQYNLSKQELPEPKPLGIFFEEDGKKLAGLTGDTFGNWLLIRYLCVDEKHRKKGVGKSLMEAAEAEARKRECKYILVDTFDFQAPGFYRKLGYKDAFKLTDYPYTGKRFYFTKVLD